MVTGHSSSVVYPLHTTSSENLDYLLEHRLPALEKAVQLEGKTV